MAISDNHKTDIETILAKRHHLGGDYWTTTDKRLNKGGVFSLFSSVQMLLELGMKPSEPILLESADVIFGCWRDDGRICVVPEGAIYPCQTISAANTLCSLGYANDARIRITLDYLLQTQHELGGWKCNKFSYGRGPETEFANPGPTLTALSMFRHTSLLNKEESLDKAVEFLLEHWVTRIPIGPCHYGIGSLFNQVEYPFMSYNLFVYVYVLSFYDYAKNDVRYLDAFATLQSKIVDGMIVVERVNRNLTDFIFCKKNAPSVLGTKRYLELKRNLNI